MSYDLYLQPRGGSLDQIRAHFQSRPNYNLTESEALYENQATGVYFSFWLKDESMAFNLNYFRPHVFALEAETELTALIERFELGISDPQSEGMGDGPYSPEGFLHGWNAGNRFAHRAFAQEMKPADLRTLPTRALFEVWNWNFLKPIYEDLLCSIEMTVGFVPTIVLLETAREPGRVITAVIWADAMPIALPHVDHVLVAGELAPMGPTLVPFAQIAPLLSTYPKRQGHRFTLDMEREVALHHIMVDHDEPPPGLISDLRALVAGRIPEELSRIGIDQVLDRELVFGKKD